MSFLTKNRYTITLGALLAVTFLTAPAQCDKCCLSTMMNIETMKSIWVNVGYTNVQTISNTCDLFSYSGTRYGIIYTTTYKALDNNAVETSLTMTSSGQIIPVSDTTSPDFCNTATKKGTLNVPASNQRVSFSGIFHGQVKVVFDNPSRSAHIRIFNARGVKVNEQSNVREAEYAWTPASLIQGLYVINVVTRENTVTQQVLYLK